MSTAGAAAAASQPLLAIGEVRHARLRPAPNRFAYPTREQALSAARTLGCTGAHRMGRLWMPCEHHPGP